MKGEHGSALTVETPAVPITISDLMGMSASYKMPRKVQVF
jgi:hypothetical protein